MILSGSGQLSQSTRPKISQSGHSRSGAKLAPVLARQASLHTRCRTVRRMNDRTAADSLVPKPDDDGQLFVIRVTNSGEERIARYCYRALNGRELQFPMFYDRAARRRHQMDACRTRRRRGAPPALPITHALARDDPSRSNRACPNGTISAFSRRIAIFTTDSSYRKYPLIPSGDPRLLCATKEQSHGSVSAPHCRGPEPEEE